MSRPPRSHCATCNVLLGDRNRVPTSRGATGQIYYRPDCRRCVRAANCERNRRTRTGPPDRCAACGGPLTTANSVVEQRRLAGGGTRTYRRSRCRTCLAVARVEKAEYRLLRNVDYAAAAARSQYRRWLGEMLAEVRRASGRGMSL